MDPVDRDIAIRTVLSEAGNQSALGQAAVANVLRNRAQSGRYGGQDLASVALAPNQFEPWSRGTLGRKNDPTAIDPNSPEYESAGRIVDAVMSGQHPDPTGGATHFYSPGSQSALGRDAPAWANGRQGIKIGDQMFYNLDPQTVAQNPQNNAVEAQNNTLASQNNAVAPQNNAVANPQTMPSPSASAAGMPQQGAGSAPAGGPQMPPNMQQLMAMLAQHGVGSQGQSQQPAPGLLARLLTGGQPGQGQGLSSLIPTPNNGAGLFGMPPQEGGVGGKPATPQQPQMGSGQPQAGGLAALLQHLFGGGGAPSGMPPATA